ncbi:hypothetical protein [Methanosphaera cuniculi]|uniref:Uncharacterized protein n=1 Tax=Methanosphaera cuniculi TaxID=1077256 RepID=A0A2A2HDP0_9EURY|nr:hypothetical protein [Methanosphaera cuniculi]PAV07542.1 hypothetical protein ASJ82_07650 [Methanosphaera cuniculi]PWL08141.1 hypothetical protein MSCUN_10720 [Methanosphaera cuniculi]
MDKIITTDDGMITCTYSKIYSSKTIKQNSSGENIHYVNYRTNLPESIVKLFDNDIVLYWYLHDNNIYLTNVCPDDDIIYARRRVINKRGGFLIALPKSIFPCLDNVSYLEFIVFLEKCDFVSGDVGLIECCVKV